MMNKKNISIIGIIAIALLVGYGVGYFTHPAATPAQSARGNFSGTTGGNFPGTRTGGVSGGGLLTGTVAAQDSGSITLNTRDGSSHIVLITPNTSVSKSVTGALTDIATGSTVIVSGTTNSDGSVSASSIQLRPITTPIAQ